MTHLTAWNIKQLEDQLQRSLCDCHTQLELDCCKAIAGREIREQAIKWAAERKLTPGEVAIATKYGYKE